LVVAGNRAVGEPYEALDMTAKPARFDVDAFFDAEIHEHLDLARNVGAQLGAAFAQIVHASALSVQGGGKLLFFGNGGSAADAQHLATELTIRYRDNRAPIAAIALTTDTSALTAAGNDLGFDAIFSRQIEALGRRGDVAVGISTSGRSPNVLNGLRQARDLGLVTIGLTGAAGGTMAALCNHLLVVPSTVTARIQEMHILLGQMLCGALEKQLGLV
jgi:D-sedoheptulose 7-phosphate isomerase